MNTNRNRKSPKIRLRDSAPKPYAVLCSGCKIGGSLFDGAENSAVIVGVWFQLLSSLLGDSTGAPIF